MGSAEHKADLTLPGIDSRRLKGWTEQALRNRSSGIWRRLSLARLKVWRPATAGGRAGKADGGNGHTATIAWRAAISPFRVRAAQSCDGARSRLHEAAKGLRWSPGPESCHEVRNL